MLDTIRTAVSEFAVGESGRVEQQRALPFAWTAGMLVGAAAVVSAPGVADAGMCQEGQINIEDCPGHCYQFCDARGCPEWSCLTEHVCACL